MRKVASLLLALALAILLCAPALGEGTVYTTASVNLRQGPGLSYAKVTALQPGTGLEYLGRISTDERGVDWYQVRYYGEAVWISSRYAYLDPALVASSTAADDYLAADEDISAIPLATPQAVITQVPSFDDEATLAPTFGVPGMIELSGYCHTSLKGSAIALGLTDYIQDPIGELSNFYYNDVLLIAGNVETDHIRVSGAGYTVYGVYVGMDINSAQAVLTAAGLTQFSGTMGLYFQHPFDGVHGVDSDGYDSGISVVTDASGSVTEISWTAYSG